MGGLHRTVITMGATIGAEAVATIMVAIRPSLIASHLLVICHPQRGLTPEVHRLVQVRLQRHLVLELQAQDHQTRRRETRIQGGGERAESVRINSQVQLTLAAKELPKFLIHNRENL